MSLGILLDKRNRLGQLLKAFEDRFLIAMAIITKLAIHDGDKPAQDAMSGMIVNWPKLRKALMSSKPLGQEFDIPKAALGSFLEDSALYSIIPQFIKNWLHLSEQS